MEIAKKALTKYYKENKLPVLLGVEQGPDFKRSEDAVPESEFSGKGKRSGESKGIVSLMNMLIEDLEDEIKNGIKDEARTHEEFEADMKAAENLKEELIENKVNLIDTIVQREEEKTDEHEDMSVNHGDKADELNYKAEIKPDCDWIIRSFTDRHNARDERFDHSKGVLGRSQGAIVDSKVQLQR